MENSQRLTYRKLLPSDEAYIYQLGSNINVMRYINGETIGEDESVLELDRILKLCTEELGYWVAFNEADEFIGWFALIALENTGEIEIGYRLLEQHWNKGFATEGARNLLQYGFDTLNLDRIVAVVDPENKASRHVLDKLYMKFIKSDHFYNRNLMFYEIEKAVFKLMLN